MFRRWPDSAPASVELWVDGRPVMAREADSVAAALLAAGYLACRTTPVSGSPRGPYCMMGVCFDCLVSVDGVPNQQGCLTPVRSGMQVELQQGARRLVP